MSDSSRWQHERRLRAIALFQQGWQQKKIAEALGVTKGAVSQWVKKVKDIPPEAQSEALRIKKSPGRPRAIDAEQSPKLLALIDQGAEAAGFVGDVWTAARIRVVARRELSLIVSLATIKNFLHRERYSVQKPEVKATQQSEAAVEQFRANWESLKKGQWTREQP